ncbi:hypothetical protein SS1G_13843 [Sclerotinia sclerotiorum 1980 UF-70]|uniref:Uncharacterized protein n=1 Tax=Sclerotinia sclerotiorum (strain ATCC 18683 / 1980 / Ss-1) TaxID=665079 RepID=A7F8B2_SCLS1|nr:hypothetical protein SS1G_13843 [Sclerotinia sclerotiorum 1980 UF-70]EDN98983.1 hypothetical protein SS1G_13843 [Sclerotinia sclerotiorum 1980 UF-70]
MTFWSIISYIKRLAYENTLLNAENHILRKANVVLSKCRYAKKIQLRNEGVLIGQEAEDILSQQKVDIQIQCDKRRNGGNSNGEASSNRCYRTDPYIPRRFYSLISYLSLRISFPK